jgi:hypothetical protein
VPESAVMWRDDLREKAITRVFAAEVMGKVLRRWWPRYGDNGGLATGFILNAVEPNSYRRPGEHILSRILARSIQ